MAPRQEPYVKYWHAGSSALTVKITVPITCTLLSRKISTQHHDCPLRVRIRRLSSLRRSLCSNPERYFMTVTHNPKAAADQARAAYRRTTDQLGNLGLETAVPEGVLALVSA